jgi:hypothetical protein
MPARGFPNKITAQAWDCYVECAIRALWICRCKNKMSNGIFNTAKVVSLFLALFATVLNTVLINYQQQRLEEADFLRDWCGEGRIAFIDRNKKLKLSWMCRD